ncbi:uncharacterized protein LOC134256924 [Saccostrea cucullata]|uniref:uncharacterized protein LOC134256924 n=1 Tax=Saccostrea cuccullata TaxID=36930 RepID=UPI002ED4707A
MKLLEEIQCIAAGKRKIRIENQLSPGVFHEYLKVEDVREVYHISFVTTDMVWISDSSGHTILTNKKGTRLHILADTGSRTGGHCVNREGNLIYVDKYHNINKLSTDKKTHKRLLKNTESWEAKCVHCSPFNADLLVGMRRYERNKPDYSDAKVMRYSSEGQEIETIYNDKGRKLYKFPRYITENHNGDVIVSDLYKHAVVVTNPEGIHRFSYTGPPTEPELSLSGGKQCFTYTRKAIIR